MKKLRESMQSDHSPDKKWWKLWNELEKREENDLIQERDNEMMVRRSLVSSLESSDFSFGRSSMLRDSLRVVNRHESLERNLLKLVGILRDGHKHIVDDPNYLGLHLTSPLTLPCVLSMLENFRSLDDLLKTKSRSTIRPTQQKARHRVPLHPLYVLDILGQAKSYFVQAPNLQRIQIEKNHKVTIVGDLHGQLKDLLHIFDTNGLPSESHFYVFNGDFVDRGHFSTEVVILLFAFKILYPHRVFLNRGNHEARDICSRDGFSREVQTKYDMDMFDAFIDVFATLPIGVLINKDVLVVHGGLSWENFSLEALDAIDRFAEIPSFGSLLEDILWSDPMISKGTSLNDRGAGCVFGPDHLIAFLRHNSLRVLVRSHQCVQMGAESLFGGKLWTIFSASNYCGSVDNQGAVLCYEGETFPRPIVKRHCIVEAGDRKFKHGDMPMVAVDVVCRVVELVMKRNDSLRSFWRKHVQNFDERRSELRMISVNEWAEGMKKVLKVNIPWEELAELIVKPSKAMTSSTFIDYDTFLRYNSAASYLHRSRSTEEEILDHKVLGTMTLLINIIYQNRFDLETAFKWLDQSGSGFVSFDEFKMGLKSLLGLQLLNQGGIDEELEEFSECLFDDGVVREVLRLIDIDNDGRINYDDFLQTFEVAIQDCVSQIASQGIVEA